MSTAPAPAVAPAAGAKGAAAPSPPAAAHSTPFNCIMLSQNIGTIECNSEQLTEEQQTMAVRWAASVSQFLMAEEQASSQPIDVVVLHLQEVGGKKFNKALNTFLNRIILQCFPRPGWCSGLLMPDEEDQTFTAMATTLWVSNRAVPFVSVLSYRHRTYIATADDPLDWVRQSRRALFMGAKFSTAGTSRKGYLLTSLRVGCTVLNFLNVHLFHDADNATAIKASPSEFALKRVDAMLEAIEAISCVARPDDPLFVFGDFNTRLDAQKLSKMLSARFGPVTAEKKMIKAPEAVWDYLQSPGSWPELEPYDTDMPLLIKAIGERRGVLFAEMPRRFPMTYLLEAQHHDDEIVAPSSSEATVAPATSTGSLAASFAAIPRVQYARERFPAWCDRILFNSHAAAVMDESAYFYARLYAMDHFPVYLRFNSTHLLPFYQAPAAGAEQALPTAAPTAA